MKDLQNENRIVFANDVFERTNDVDAQKEYENNSDTTKTFTINSETGEGINELLLEVARIVARVNEDTIKPINVKDNDKHNSSWWSSTLQFFREVFFVHD